MAGLHGHSLQYSFRKATAYSSHTETSLLRGRAPTWTHGKAAQMILMSSQIGEPLGQRAVRQMTKKGQQQAGVSGEEEAGRMCLGE